jgi:hypothetical protein
VTSGLNPPLRLGPGAQRPAVDLRIRGGERGAPALAIAATQLDLEGATPMNPGWAIPAAAPRAFTTTVATFPPGESLSFS